MSKTPVPSFERPPVTETVLGVSFEPIAGWSIPYHGLFWNTVRSELPKTQSHQPLDVVIETNASVPPQKSRLQIMNVPKARCWFIDDSGHDLIQVQDDRFIYNWRKNLRNVDYPRYQNHVRVKFQSYWEKYQSFVRSEIGLDELKVSQCEVTYFNHILRDEVNFGWSEVLESFNTHTNATFLPQHESLRFEQTFAISDNQGRFRVSGYPAVRTQDAAEILVLELTARGKPRSSSMSDILAWLDLGREWVVRGFKDLTTATMHKHWGLIEND